MRGYEVEVEGFGREEANDYVKNKCKDCDIQNSCNGEDVAKCNEKVEFLIGKFKNPINLPIKKEDKVFHITHTDLDGAGCAVLMNMVIDDITFAYVEAGEANNYLANFLTNGGADDYDYILMTDLSIPPTDYDTLRLVEEKAKGKFFLVDHHKTALELNKYDWAYVASEGNPTPCATSLLADILGVDNIRVKNFVEMVRSYDVWDWVKTDSLEPSDLDLVNRSLGQEGFVYAYSRHLVEYDYFFSKMCKEIVKGRRRRLAEQVEEDLKESFVFEMGGLICAAVLCSRNGNEITTRLFEKYPQVDFTIKVNPASGTISFRSKEGKADVSEIAKFFGGGGHMRASGVKLDTTLFKKCLVQILSHYNEYGVLGRCVSCDNILTVEDILPKTKEVKCKQCQSIEKLSKYYIE